MKHLITRLTIAFTLSTTLINFANAQFSSTGGPNGEGNLHALLAFNDTIFAGINAHCMRTFDGVHWKMLTNGLGAGAENVNPYCISRIGNTLYMGTNNGSRVYRSSDWGETWIPYSDSLVTPVPMMSVSSGNKVFMTGTNFNLVYTTTANDGWHNTGVGGLPYGLSVLGKDTIWASLGGKIWGTTNNGNTWSEINHGSMYNPSDFVMVGSRIIALTDAGGVNTCYYSDNFGSTWTQATTGFAIGKRVVKISDDKIMGIGYGGLYKTTDKGVNWSLVSDIPGRYLELWKNKELLVGTSAGLFNIPDPEVPFSTLLEMPFSNVKGMIILNNKIFALTARGLFSRPIGGGSWTMISNLRTLYTNTLNKLRFFGGKLYVMTDMGAFYTSDEGANFTPVAGLQNVNINDYFVNGNIHLAAKRTKYIIYEYTDSIFYSSNSGANWSKTALTGFPANSFLAFGFTQHNSKIFLEGTNGYGTSTDNGATWTHNPTTQFGYYIGNRIYSYDGVLIKERFDSQGGNTTGIEKSTDNGTSWVSDTIGLPINTVFKNPNTAGVFFSDGKLFAYSNMIGSEGLFSKSAAGANWVKLSNTGKIPSNPVHLVANGSDVFVAVTDNGVWSTQSSSGLSDQNPYLGYHLDIYPNPSDGKIILETNLNQQAPGKIELFNLLGEKLFSETVPSGQGKTELNLTENAPGIYLIKYQTGDQIFTKKIIIE